MEKNDEMNNKMPIILLGILIVSICGCATQKQGLVAEKCPPDKSLVYIYRIQHSFMTPTRIDMYVNGKRMVGLYGKEYSPLIINPGPATFSIGFRYGPDNLLYRTVDELSLQAEAGKTYFVMYKYDTVPFREHPPLMSVVDEKTGENDVSQCKFVMPISEKKPNISN